MGHHVAFVLLAEKDPLGAAQAAQVHRERHAEDHRDQRHAPRGDGGDALGSLIHAAIGTS